MISEIESSIQNSVKKSNTDSESAEADDMIIKNNVLLNKDLMNNVSL